MFKARPQLLLAESEKDVSSWVVFSDVALSMLLVLLLFILAQFLHYEKIAVLERIRERQEEVATLILEHVSEQERDSITISREDDYHQRISFQSELLFRDCEARIKMEGQNLLEIIGAAIATRAGYFEAIQVEGHTDRRGTAQCPGIVDNWDLSARRATEVVRLFSDRIPLEPELLTAVGKGHFHPVSGAEGDTPEDYDRNRRIELVLRYSEDGALR